MIAILGGGESGIGAALLAAKMGKEVFVSDMGTISAPFKQVLREHHIPFEEKGHSIEKIKSAEEVIKSPGIPPDAAIVQAIEAKGIPIIGEIEYAYRHCQGRIIAVTGSNGKTTTTNLVHHLLSEAGMKVSKCGNVGHSFAKAVMLEEPDYYVVELSSFQLEDIVSFRPDIAIITNISPDHLDRYRYDIEQYARAKFRIAMNQRAGDVLIIGSLDAPLKKVLYEMAPSPQKIEVGSGQANRIQIEGTTYMKYQNPSLRGRHNGQNASCAVAAAQKVGLTEEDIRRGLETFVNDPHRMEEVANIGGVRYINDSKATNVDAVYYALDAMEGPVIWIAGGVDKGNDYTQLYEVLHNNVKALICLGKDNEKLTEAFKGKIQTIKEAHSMEEAIQLAKKIAQEGDTILLSPACASFDLFDNYMHRGDVFRTLTKKINE